MEENQTAVLPDSLQLYFPRRQSFFKRTHKKMELLFIICLKGKIRGKGDSPVSHMDAGAQVHEPASTAFPGHQLGADQK